MLFPLYNLSTLLTFAKMPLSPFPEAQDLLIRAHKTGMQFSHGKNRCEELHSYENNVPGNLAIICVKLDLSKTRVSERHSLVHSILWIHEGLAYDFVGKEGSWAHTSEDFKKLTDAESITCLPAQHSMFSQFYKPYTSTLEL